MQTVFILKLSEMMTSILRIIKRTTYEKMYCGFNFDLNLMIQIYKNAYPFNGHQHGLVDVNTASVDSFDRHNGAL